MDQDGIPAEQQGDSGSEFQTETEPQHDEAKPLTLDIPSILASRPKLDAKGRAKKRVSRRMKQRAPSDFAKELTARLQAVEMTQIKEEDASPDRKKVMEHRRNKEGGPGSSGTEEARSESETSGSEDGGGAEELGRARKQRARRVWWCKLAMHAVTTTLYAVAATYLSMLGADTSGDRCEHDEPPCFGGASRHISLTGLLTSQATSLGRMIRVI